MSDEPGIADGAWFLPKRFGYGAGLPCRWQGWAMLAAHIAAIVAGIPLTAGNPRLFTVYTLVVAVLPLPIYAAKTRGGWKWRMGKD